MKVYGLSVVDSIKFSPHTGPQREWSSVNDLLL